MSEKIKKLSPFRETDLKVATEVLGLGAQVVDDDILCWEQNTPDAKFTCPEYSTDIAAAWLLVDYLVASGAGVDISRHMQWECQILAGTQTVYKPGVTAAEAICNALLFLKERQVFLQSEHEKRQLEAAENGE